MSTFYLFPLTRCTGRKGSVCSSNQAGDGRPRSNLSENEREELLRLVRKLEPGAFGRGAVGALRGRVRR